MPIILVPHQETPEDWRTTILGRIACFAGWHFGQVAISDPWIDPVIIQCAGCRRTYYKRAVCVIWNTPAPGKENKDE